MFPAAHGSPGDSGVLFRNHNRSSEMQHPMLLQSPLEPHMMLSGVAKSSFQYLLPLVCVPKPSIFNQPCFRGDFSLIAQVLSRYCNHIKYLVALQKW